MHIVERTCTEVPENRLPDLISISSQSLFSHRELSVYVLLGEPGAGKTTVFEQEASRPDTFYVTARDLITYDYRPADS